MITNDQFHYLHFFGDVGIYSELFKSKEFPWQALFGIEDFIKNFKDSSLSQDFHEISENVFIGKNVEIDDTSRIKGMAIIGHNSVLGHSSFLRGNVLIGDNVNVGHATEIKHSIILSNTALAHLNYIGDSIVGSNCNISGGATLANWRFDKKEIVIKNKDGGLSTNLEKLGGILGDNTFIGVNAVINPGTVLAKNTLVFPLVSVRGTHITTETIKE